MFGEIAAAGSRNDPAALLPPPRPERNRNLEDVLGLFRLSRLGSSAFGVIELRANSIVAGGVTMTQQTREHREIIAIIVAAAAGEASADQLAQISRRVLEDDAWSTFVLELMGQEAWLCWHASQACSTEQRVSGDEPFDGFFTSIEQARQRAPLSINHENLGDIVSRTGTAHSFGQNPIIDNRAASSRKTFWVKASLAAALLLAIGATLGSLADRSWNGNQGAAPIVADDSERGATA